MKKIFSLILVSIALVVFGSGTAMAADASAFDVVVSFNAEKLEIGTEAEMTITFNFDGEYKLAAFEVPFVLNNLVLGDLVSMTDGFSASGMAINDGKFIWSDANQLTPFTSVSFTYKVTAENAGTASIAIDEYNTFACDDYTVGDIYASETEADASIEVAAAGGDEEEKVVMTAAPFFTAVAESAENNGWQKGQAVALQFKTADLAEFVAMNWKLTVEGLGDRFAKVDDAAFATIQATDAETVDVFASFIVNTAENAEATPITAVSAGFKKADGTVVEAE